MEHQLKYENLLKAWANDEKAAFELTNYVGNMFYDKNVELRFFKRQLIDRSSSIFLNYHSYAATVIGKKLRIQDTLILVRELNNLVLPPARIDIGRLNYEWTQERGDFQNDVHAFLQKKLSHIIGKKPMNKEPKDVVLYGFGRIGRLVLRELIIQGNGLQLRPKGFTVRKIDENMLFKRSSLMRHDSVHGPFRGNVIENYDDNTIYANGHVIHLIEAKNPDGIDYTQFGIDNALLIDNTGVFKDEAGLGRHLNSKGIDKVLLTAPASGDIPNIVYGVNHLDFNPEEHQILSAASCTTNAIVPTLDVIDRNFGIVKGHVETIHAYTNDQNLLDNYHKKPRRGRAAPLNMVLTSTGAGNAAAKVLPNLKGKLTANAIRVPTPNVSLAILNLTVDKKTSREEVNEVIKKAALTGERVEQIRYSSSTESVSSDFIGDPVPGIFDSPSTIVSKDGHTIQLYVWYDNEFGYTMQVIRLAKYFSGVLRYVY
jgi:glyceraldehyde 3-phosphate dehydrogenase